MKILALAAALALAGPAEAQFNLRDLNVNRLVETVKNVGKATREPTQEEEIALGRDVAARLVGAAPLVADARAQRYVNHVGRWLASQTERADLPWKFGVLEAPQINAFAVPGGTIFITRGLLEKMGSEADLAGAALTNVNSEARHKLVSFGTEMYSRGLDKGDELEADRLGVVIAARAGYDAYGLPSVLQTLQGMNAADSSLALMFKTHPAPGERLDALGKRMQ